MDRRSFVKTAVGVAAIGATAATGVAMTVPLAKPRPPAAPEIPYVGFHKVGGPAPRGTPLIPIFVNERGEFEGRPLIEGAPAGLGGPTLDILAWYKFCGHGEAPGLRHDWPEDSVLRYFIAEDKLKLGLSPWFKDLLDQPIRPEHFREHGLGASFVWRSQGQTGANVLSGVILRWPKDQYVFAPEKVIPPGKGIRSESDQQFIRENMMHADEFVASSTFCPHFCCIPGYKEAERLAASRDAADKLFCTCHFSIYNPRELVSYTFSPETASGAHEEAAH